MNYIGSDVLSFEVKSGTVDRLGLWRSAAVLEGLPEIVPTRSRLAPLPGGSLGFGASKCRITQSFRIFVKSLRSKGFYVRRGNSRDVGH